MSDLDLLRRERREIAELTRLHANSILFFRAPNRPWFKLQASEPDQLEEVRHRTTTASCLESLADVPLIDQEETGHETTDRRVLASEFAKAALAEDSEKWQSEGAAHVYCRVRTLPAILTSAPDVASNFIDAIADHLKFIWDSVSPEPRRQAIHEHTEPRDASQATGNDVVHDEGADTKQDPNYPPNAFQTYWALCVLNICTRLPSLQDIVTPYDERRDIAALWTQNMLAAQIALHEVRSERADPNQLAWALIAQFVDPTRPIEPAAGEFVRRDLYEAALKAFFAQQLESGEWPLGQPLFHYPRAGNAYCYTYETLTALLRPALLAQAGRMLRELLRPYLPQLLKAWHAARENSVALSADGAAVGWRSGHHPHRTQPEGWATASVFSYLQCLRRIVGIWAKEEAGTELGVRPANYASSSEAAEELAARGDTWTGGNRWSAGEQLASLFLHPVAATGPGGDDLDPDLPLIRKDQARSAILFGPPGTGKTTLVEALAGSLGWDFVEVHASHFLSEGMDRVAHRADEIFVRLMELDHCVVLFDEVDELLRERLGGDSDPFGRFLTTSMLPKVARLWEQRRVLFFVATNDIRHADRSIKRSQRFDAAILVGPSSFETKVGLMKELAPEVDLSVLSQDQVAESLKEKAEESPLGYFALVRWDQVHELAEKVREEKNPDLALQNALGEMGPRLAESDWLPPDSEPAHDAYRAFAYLEEQERRDFGRLRLISVKAPAVPATPSGMEQFVSRNGTTYLTLVRVGPRPPRQVEVEGQRLRRNRLLEYR